MPSLLKNGDVASLSIFVPDSLISQAHFLHLQNSVLPNNVVTGSRHTADESIVLFFHSFHICFTPFADQQSFEVLKRYSGVVEVM